MSDAGGTELTCEVKLAMSVGGGKADLAISYADFRFDPNCDVGQPLETCA